MKINVLYKYKIALSLLLCVVMLGCEKAIDNYDAPNAGVYGSIIDRETNEPIPLPVGTNSGSLVSMYEQSASATNAITTRAKSTGAYSFSTLYNSKYRVNVDGPFIGLCEGYIDVKGQTEFNLYTLPFSRITADASVDDNNVVTVNYKVVKTDPGFSLTNVSVIWNYVPEVDNNSTNYASINSMGLTVNSTYKINLYNDAAFAENHYKIVSNQNRIYVRVSATVNSVVNYSKVITLKVK